MTERGREPRKPSSGHTPTRKGISRRSMLGALGSSLALPIAMPRMTFASGDTGVQPMDLPLPLDTICGHAAISVRDVTESARFYSKVFGGENVSGEREPFLRYMINLNPGKPQLGEGGGVAIGKLGTLGSQGKTVPLIDHFCFNAKPFPEAAWKARLREEGLTYIAQGVFADIDGILVQIAGATGGESLAAGEIERMEPLYVGAPLVLPMGFEHITLHVGDLERSVAFYRRMFELGEPDRRDGTVYFSDGRTRLGLKQAYAGEAPNIHHYAVKVRPFDKPKLIDGLSALGAEILPVDDEQREIVRFADPDRLIVELWSV